MSFRATCPNCQSKCVITSSNEVSKGIDNLFVKDLYCRCVNPDCFAVSVLRVSHSHYLQPPVGHVLEMAKAIVKQHDEQLTLEV